MAERKVVRVGVVTRLVRAGCALCLTMTTPVFAQNLSFYGSSGLIDTPAATALQDGDLAISVVNMGATTRYNLTFQVTPRLQASARYAILRGLDGGAISTFEGDRFDRSFDVQFLLLEEARFRPALAIGLRDFAGTGVYSSEYIVASKSLSPKVRVSGGIGWGRLGTQGGFENPFSAFDDRFKTRSTDFGLGGDLQTNAWFRGDAAFFGGVEWQATDQLRVVAEYSSDAYVQESEAGIIDVESPWNLGLSYRFKNGVTANLAYLYGSEVGLSFSYVFNPKNPRAPGGQEPAPQSLLPSQTVAAQSWNLGPAASRGPATRNALAQRLLQQGLRLVSYSNDGTTARLRVENLRYQKGAQALGRTARVLSNTVDPKIRDFDITFVVDGTPQTSVKLRRDDFEALEYDLEGSWRSLARAEISDAFDVGRGGTLPGLYPRFDWSLGPYTAFSFFDPDQPLRYDLGVSLDAAYEPRPGLIFSGQFRYPLLSTIDDDVTASNSVLTRVRTDAGRYAVESDFEVRHLTAAYYFRPGEDLFGRVTVGYLEPMFGGLSTELLWYPLDSRLALGIEANYARQRDFDLLFGFQEYDVWTGHASAYYDFGNGFRGQVDVGRYLAGDWGATISLDREFNNGFKVGGFFTLTDVPFEEFGEGSFDKGLRVSIPVSWLTGKPSREVAGTTLRPVQRDGGARLKVRGRLFAQTKDYRGKQLADGWGKFYR